jgi:hypothetical protein
MRVPLMLTTAVGWSLCSGIAAAQTPAHVDAVKNAQKSAYAVVDSTNGCPAADRDLFGWPRNLVLNCEYAKQDAALGRKRRAVAYLLDVKPEVIARWIEGACAQLRNKPADCFKKVLSAGQGNSGYMFALGQHPRGHGPAESVQALLLPQRHDRVDAAGAQRIGAGSAH